MKKNHVCPVEFSGSLDNKFRRWFQNPIKILEPFVKENMTVLDMGCGPGFFTIDMANMVGTNGRVIAVDLQDGMLQIVKGKISGSPIEKVITLYKCDENRIGVTDTIDFALLFYMVHEVEDKNQFFKEIKSILKPGGKILMVEPKFHVSEKDFVQTIDIATNAGFSNPIRKKILFSKVVVLHSN